MASDDAASTAADRAAAFYQWSVASRARLETVVDRKQRFGEDLWYGELLDALRTDVVPQLSEDGTLALEPSTIPPFHAGVPLIGSPNDPTAAMFALSVDPIWACSQRTLKLLPNVPWLVAEHTWAAGDGDTNSVATVWGAPSAGFLEELCSPGAPESITIELSREIGAGAVVDVVRRLTARQWHSDAPRITVDIRPGGASNAERKKAADALRAHVGSSRGEVRIDVDSRIDHPEPTAYGVDWLTASQHLKEPDLLAEVASSPGDPLRARLETRPGSSPGRLQEFRGEALHRPTFAEIAYVFCAAESTAAVAALHRFGTKQLGSFYPATPLTLGAVIADKLRQHCDSGLPVVVVACPGDAVATRIAVEQLPPSLRVAGFVTSHEEATELHANVGLPAHVCSQTYSGTQGFRNPSGVRALRDKLSRQRELLREFDESRRALGHATASGAHPLAGLITPLRNHQLNLVRSRKLGLPEEEISPWPGLLVSRTDGHEDGFTLLRGFLPDSQRGLTLALPTNEPEYVTSSIRSAGPHHQSAWALHFGESNLAHLRALVASVRPTQRLDVLVGQGRDARPVVELVRTLLADARALDPDTAVGVTFSHIHSPGHSDACAELVKLAAGNIALSVRAKALHPVDRRLLAAAATPEQRRSSRAQTWQRDLLPSVLTSAMRAIGPVPPSIDRPDPVPPAVEPRQLAGDLDQAKHLLVVCADPSVGDRELPGAAMARQHRAAVIRCVPEHLEQTLTAQRQQRLDADRLPAPTVVLPVGSVADRAYAALGQLPEQLCPDALWVESGWWGQRARRLKTLPGAPAVYVYGRHRSEGLLAHAELGFRATTEAAQLRRDVDRSRDVNDPEHPLADDRHPVAALRDGLVQALADTDADGVPRPPRVLVSPTSLTVINGPLTFASERTVRIAATTPEALTAALAASESVRRQASATVFGSPTPEELRDLVLRGRVPDHVTFVIDDPEFLETTFDAAVSVAKQLIASPTRRRESGKDVWVVVSDSAAPRFMSSWQNLKYGAHERLPLRVLLGDDNPRPLELFDDAPLHAEVEFLPPLRPTTEAARPWANVSANGDLDHASRALVICTDSQRPIRMAALRRIVGDDIGDDLVVLRSEPIDLAAALSTMQEIRAETGRSALPVDVLALPRTPMDWRKVWQALHDAPETPPGTVWLPEGSVEVAAAASTVELPGSVEVATYPAPLASLPADVIAGVPATVVARNQLLPPMLQADLGRPGTVTPLPETPEPGSGDAAEPGSTGPGSTEPSAEHTSLPGPPVVALPGPRPRPRPGPPNRGASVSDQVTGPDPWAVVEPGPGLVAAAQVLVICEPGKPTRKHVLRSRIEQPAGDDGGNGVAVVSCLPRQLADVMSRLREYASGRGTAITVLTPDGVGAEGLRRPLADVAEQSAPPDAAVIWPGTEVTVRGFTPAMHYLVGDAGLHALTPRAVLAQRAAGAADRLTPHQLGGAPLVDAVSVFVACGDWQGEQSVMPAPLPDRLGPLETALELYPDAAALQCTPTQLPDLLAALRAAGSDQPLPVTVMAWPGSGPDVHEFVTDASAVPDGSVLGAPAMLWLSDADAAVLEAPAGGGFAGRSGAAGAADLRRRFATRIRGGSGPYLDGRHADITVSC